MAVPVHWGGQLRGVLSVAYRLRISLGRQHLDALESFAELAAVAFNNAAIRARLAEAARTDPLTGCLNHAAMHEGLAASRSRRPARCWSGGRGWRTTRARGCASAPASSRSPAGSGRGSRR